MGERLVKMPAEDAVEPQVKLGLTSVRTAIEWGGKAIFALWLLFQFYSNQTVLAAKVASEEGRIKDLENATNELKRELGIAQGQIIGLHDQAANDRAFYLQTQKR